jgi:hypothetical protein
MFFAIASQPAIILVVVCLAFIRRKRMVQITISDELAQAITEAGQLVTLVDSSGRALAHATPVEPVGPIGMTEEHCAELERRRREDDGTRFTWEQVKEHLRTLAAE